MVLLAVTIFFENSGDLESSCQPVIYLKTFIKISRNIPPTLHPATGHHSPTSLPHCWDCIHCGGLGPAYAKHAGTNLGKTNSSVIWLRNLLLISVRLILMFVTVLCWRETSCLLWWTLCESSNTWLCFQELDRAREQLLWFDLLLLIIYASVLLLIDTHK